MEELGAAETAESATGSSVSVGSGSGLGSPASGVGLGAATAPDQVEFLCPNDHLLHGPSALQGRPGQCPVCGSKFRIPVYQEEAASEPPKSAAGRADQAAEGSSVELADGEHDAAGTGSEAGREGTSGTEPNRPPSSTGQPGQLHPAAQLMARLWRLKSQGATIELRYGEGHRLTPDEYVTSLSSATHAVFSVKEPNGTLTLTAMPWESIHAVVVRGVRPSGRDGD